MMAMRQADNRSDLLEVQWVFLILALRCPLALFLSWRTEPTSAKVRKYPAHAHLSHLETLMHYCEVLFPRWNSRCDDCALLVFLL